MHLCQQIKQLIALWRFMSVITWRLSAKSLVHGQAPQVVALTLLKAWTLKKLSETTFRIWNMRIRKQISNVAKGILNGRRHCMNTRWKVLSLVWDYFRIIFVFKEDNLSHNLASFYQTKNFTHHPTSIVSLLHHLTAQLTFTCTPYPNPTYYHSRGNWQIWHQSYTVTQGSTKCRFWKQLWIAEKKWIAFIIR